MKNKIVILALAAFTFFLTPHLALARYLSTDTGRFMTMDTYQGSNKDPLSLHRYIYAENNPGNNIDPTGKAILVNKTGDDVVITGNVGSGHGSGAQVYGVIPKGQTGGGVDHPIAAYSTREDALKMLKDPSQKIQSVGNITDVDWYDDPSRSNHDPLSEPGKVIGDEEGPKYDLIKGSDGHYTTSAYKTTVPGAYFRRGLEKIGNAISSFFSW